MNWIAPSAHARFCDGAAAVLELGPPPGNILDRAACARLRAELRALAEDPQLKAIVLRGAGAHFSYGASVPEHLPGEVETMLPEFHALLRALGQPALPPLIALVRGKCLGGGLELALACDAILAAEDAQLGCPEVRLGVFPPAAAALLPLRVPAPLAADLVVSGRSLSSAEAARAGLVERAVPGAGLEAACEEWIRTRWSGLSGAALRHARWASRDPWRRALDGTLPALERRYLGDLMATADAREGLAAFIAKRAALEPRMSRRLEQHLLDAGADALDPEFRAARAWKEAAPGRACLGCFPVYVPQEAIWAGGALPVTVWGGGEKVEVEHADARIQSFICSISRSTLELGLTGRLDFLDGMLFGSLCDVVRNLSGVWKRNFPRQFTDYLHYPQNLRSAVARSHYVAELRRLAGEVGRLTGRNVDDADLAAALDLYEEQRALLRELGAARAARPWMLALEEWYVLALAAGRRDPAAHNRVLREVLADLPSRARPPRDGVRVLLEGSFCEQPALELLRVFDQAHCFVVDSDLCRGLRWFKEPIARGADPWQDLAGAYFDHAEGSVVRHAAPGERSERLLARARAAEAQGVVFCIAKFCEPAFYDFVLHKRALEGARIPFLTVEFEEKMGSFDSIRTQAETFAESILFFAEDAVA